MHVNMKQNVPHGVIFGPAIPFIFPSFSRHRVIGLICNQASLGVMSILRLSQNLCVRIYAYKCRTRVPGICIFGLPDMKIE
jgi:hypothetical protein